MSLSSSVKGPSAALLAVICDGRELHEDDGSFCTFGCTQRSIVLVDATAAGLTG
jgi:hypothetical protein